MAKGGHVATARRQAPGPGRHRRCEPLLRHGRRDVPGREQGGDAERLVLVAVQGLGPGTVVTRDPLRRAQERRQLRVREHGGPVPQGRHLVAVGAVARLVQ